MYRASQEGQNLSEVEVPLKSKEGLEGTETQQCVYVCVCILNPNAETWTQAHSLPHVRPCRDR